MSVHFITSSECRAGIWLSLFAVAPLATALEFETTRVLLKPRPDQSEVEAVFAFRNQDGNPAKILSAVSGCTCLKTTFTQGEISVGKSGSVSGIFKTTNQSGITEKTIQVRVEENGKQRLIPLTVAVEVPQLVVVEPRTLAWSAGGDADEKTFTVTMNWEKPIKLLEVSSSRPGFELRMETLTEGKQYRVHVKPTDAAKPMLGVFYFKTDCEFEKFAKPIAFAHVRKQ